MDYRTGKCSQCGAEYKIPASFAHNVARCRKCQGVVHLSPAPGAASQARDSAAAKRVGPKVEAAPPRAPAAGPRPSAPPSPAAPSPAAAKDGPRARAEVERAKTAEPAATSRRAVAPPPAGPERDQKRAAPIRKKAPMAKLLLAGLVVVAAALILFRKQVFGGDGAGASEVDTVPEVNTVPALEPGTPPETSSGPSPTSEARREPAARERESELGAAPPEPASEAKAKDPASIDLAGIPDFQPTPDTTPEEWTRMNGWAAQWLDVAAGAAGNRAGRELVEQTRKAVPVILNAFKKLDFATQDGRSNGDQCQRALTQICNGTNFDWKHTDPAAGRPYDHPDDVWFCKRVVELWTNAWKQAERDIQAWIHLAKLEEKDPAEAARLRERFGGQGEPEAGGSDEGD